VPRKVDGELEKVTVRLFEGDFGRLQDYYPVSGANDALRKILHGHLRRLDERLSQKESTDGEQPKIAS
jgi:hypothetical protein